MLPGVRQLHHSIVHRPRLPVDHQNEHRELYFEATFHSNNHQLHIRHGDVAFLDQLHPDCLCRLHQLVRFDVRRMFPLLRGLHDAVVLCSGLPDIVQSQH
jgi:hypothetical protein